MEVNKDERRVIQSVFHYFHTMLLERREKPSNPRMSTRRLGMDGRSLEKVCQSFWKVPIVIPLNPKYKNIYFPYFF